MFNETSYNTLGAVNPTNPDAAWMALGWPSKNAWKQAGKPNTPYHVTNLPSPGCPSGYSPGFVLASGSCGTGGMITGGMCCYPNTPIGSSGGGSSDPDAAWVSLGWPSKTAYHQAGRPNMTYTQWSATGSGSPTIIGGGTGVITDPGTGTAATPAASGGGLGDLLGGIPSSYLMIGAAIILIMVLKK